MDRIYIRGTGALMIIFSVLSLVYFQEIYDFQDFCKVLAGSGIGCCLMSGLVFVTRFH